jgi:hypothetical protein
VPKQVHQWLFNAEEMQATKEFGMLLERIGQQLQEQGSVKLAELQVQLPSTVHAMVRHERTRSNALILRLQAEWSDTGEASPTSRSLRDLLGS